MSINPPQLFQLIFFQLFSPNPVYTHVPDIILIHFYYHMIHLYKNLKCFLLPQMPPPANYQYYSLHSISSSLQFDPTFSSGNVSHTVRTTHSESVLWDMHFDGCFSWIFLLVTDNNHVWYILLCPFFQMMKLNAVYTIMWVRIANECWIWVISSIIWFQDLCTIVG